MNIAIITAKGNNTLPDKNVKNILGKPCIAYQIEAAKKAELIDDVYVTTECPKIKKIALEYGAKIIDRPEWLAKPDSNHGDVIVHAVEQTEGDIFVILLGNTVMTSPKDIDNCIEAIGDNDSAMTVWQAQDDHPYRGMTIENGLLKSFLDVEVSTNRQSYPPVYFYDQGPWAVKREVVLESKEGPGPWWWMGKKCVPVIRQWIAGRDIHTQQDIDIATLWIKYLSQHHTS
jgi:CMP-N-acetylneuraminic acid synthetase